MKNTLRKILCTVVSVLMLFTTVSATSRYSTVYDISEESPNGYNEEGFYFYGTNLPLQAKVIDGRAVLSRGMGTKLSNDMKNTPFVARTLTSAENFSDVYYVDHDDDPNTLPESPEGRVAVSFNLKAGFGPAFILKDEAGEQIAKINITEYDGSITINDIKIYTGTQAACWVAETERNFEIILDYDLKRIFMKILNTDGSVKYNTENAKVDLNGGRLYYFTDDGTKYTKAQLDETPVEGATLGVPFNNLHPIKSIEFKANNVSNNWPIKNPYNYYSFDNVSLTYSSEEIETTTAFTDTFPMSDVPLIGENYPSYVILDSTYSTDYTHKYSVVNKMDNKISYSLGGSNMNEMTKNFKAVSSGKLVAEFHWTSTNASNPYPGNTFTFYLRNGTTTVASMKAQGGTNKITDCVFSNGTNATVADESVVLGWKVGYHGVTKAISLFRFVLDLDNKCYDVYVVDSTGVVYKINADSIPFANSAASVNNLFIDTWASGTKVISKLKIYTIDDKAGNPDFANAGKTVTSASIAKGTLPIKTGFVSDVNSASIIVALYGSDNAMKKVDIISDELTFAEGNYNFADIDYTLPSECAIGDTLKVFVWDSESGLIPYCDGASISVVK